MRSWLDPMDVAYGAVPFCRVATRLRLALQSVSFLVVRLDEQAAWSKPVADPPGIGVSVPSRS